MSELFDQIVSQRGSLERLVARIPGFRGYQDKAARRKADRLLRDHIADQIAQRITHLVRIENQILDGGGLKYMSKTRTVKDRIQMYHDKIMAAAPGYSAMWAAEKIGPEELEKLYSFDEAQIRYAQKIDESLAALEQAAEKKKGIEEALDALGALATEAHKAFDLREDVLRNLDKSL